MSEEGSDTVAVLADPQFSLIEVVRPFPNFEDRYQGQPGTTPIAFPGVRDPAARNRQPGYDPNLVAGIPVPQGAILQLTVPMAFAANPPGAPVVQLYQYFIEWRFRNLRDFRNPAEPGAKVPYHLPSQSPGQPDTSAPAGQQDRVVIPGSLHSVLFQQVEPATPHGNTFTNLRVESFVPRLDPSAIVPPILPDGSTGVLQQGVLDPGAVGVGDAAKVPSFQPWNVQAAGDEMIIFATRLDPTAAWDFTDPALDQGFSNIFGRGSGKIFPQIGIYIQTGTNS